MTTTAIQSCNPADALRRIQAAGFRLRLAGDALQVSPADRLTTAQRAFIARHKAALMAALVQPTPAELLKNTNAHDDADLEECFEERAAILEFEAGFSRDEAERRAFEKKPFLQTIELMSEEEEAAIRAWSALIGETDPEIINEVIERCRLNADARGYFIGRARAELPAGELANITRGAILKKINTVNGKINQSTAVT